MVNGSSPEIAAQIQVPKQITFLPAGDAGNRPNATLQSTLTNAMIAFCSVEPYSAGNALLAQLVEHFHGKEEVVGSIPTEGSANGRYSHGGVAQLVRASGS